MSRRARVFRVFAETKHFPVADEPNRTEPNERTNAVYAKFTQDESAEKGGHHERIGDVRCRRAFTERGWRGRRARARGSQDARVGISRRASTRRRDDDDDA